MIRVMRDVWRGMVLSLASSVAFVGVTLMMSPTEAANRDLAVMPNMAAGSVPIAGEYWALLIGIDAYQHAPKLRSAVKDATGVREVLVTRYGFAPERVIALLDEQATRTNIEQELYQLGQRARPDDSVLIYYAGHGQYDDEERLGWWVPVEGKPDQPGTFITNASIRDYIAGMRARHVYLVADSCFSGTLFGQRATMPVNAKTLARLAVKRSRWGLTSGGTEPVADEGREGHSVFAYHFITLLRENAEPYLVPSRIYADLLPLVGNNTDQTPRSEPLKGAGDDGGQFVFRLASASGGPKPPSHPSGAPEPQISGTSAEEMAAMKKRLEEMEQKLAAQAKAAQPPPALQEARVRPYTTPQQVGREITGRDGAPMVLVPAGEFLYGKDNQRLSLPAFYMDQYEVTTTRYAQFMQATGTKDPDSWGEVVFVRDGDKPVVGVEWGDAGAYCRYYGKRLPNEQEWEKAARGTDGRQYPWGDTEPTGSVANFDTAGSCGWWTYCKAYAKGLVPVGSFEAGKSPYGIYNMAGNAEEWTSSDYKDLYKITRGGSWIQDAILTKATYRRHRKIGEIGTYPSGNGFRCVQNAQIAQSPAEPPKPIEEARVRPYTTPQQVGREITGRDGAPMVLVPAGEFLYGKDNQRLSLPAFYMDQYEVTTRLYSTFLHTTGHAEPVNWSQQVALVGNGDRPVVDVTWYDADAYCRSYGKRLPTEQEWEKAARGTDGRTYPWGNDMPTSRHALFDTHWNGYGTLAVVGSHPAGASPYGIQDLAGNVGEWTSSDSGNSSKVIRGGAWFNNADGLQSPFRSWRSLLTWNNPLGFRCAQDVR